MQLCRICIVIDCHDHAVAAHRPGKNILPGRKAQLPVVPFRKCRYILPHASQRGDQSGAGILCQGVLIVLQREGRPQGFIGPTLFPSLDPELGTIVDRRDSGKRIKKNMDRNIMRLLLQLGIDTFHIMIVGKTIEPDPAGMIQSHITCPFHRMGNLKIIMIVVT